MYRRAVWAAGPPGWLVGVAVAAYVVLRAPGAAASAIDEATVRVFSIGSVGSETVELHGRRVQVASPIAGHGTGFVVGNGLVMTAEHVVRSARHVVVRLPGTGGFFAARIVVADKDNDVAVLALEPNGGPAPLALSSAPPQVRAAVYAVGYPIDAARTQPQSARGIVAGFLDNGTVQLDMALNPGNSGGPIVDEHDAVVGMAIARGNVEQGVQGIGYAVPVERLLVALDDAKRRLGEAAALPAVTSRDSATVVDELVQHGALYELRKTAEQDASARNAEVERALAALTARIDDPDLLVYVAAALWNAAVVIDLHDPAARPGAVAPPQANGLSARLRASAVTACERAVKLDQQISTRSSFVQLALGSAPPSLTPPTPMATPPILRRSGGELNLHVGLVLRFNAPADTLGTGFALGLGYAPRRADQRIFPVLGVAFARVSLSEVTDEFAHSLIAGEIGVTARLDHVDVTGVIAPTRYSSAVSNADEETAVSAWVMSLRVGVAYRVNALQLGAGARLLSGPTLWLEPVYACLVF